MVIIIGRKRINPNKRKETITIGLPKCMILKLKRLDNVSLYIQKLIEKDWNKKNND